MQTHNLNLPTRGQMQSRRSVSVGWKYVIELSEVYWHHTFLFYYNIILLCSSLQMFEPGITPWLSLLWCAGITTFGDRRIKTPSPSLDLSTLLGGHVTQLGSWVWSSFGLQNSFPHITINSHSHCFLCVHLCHHLLLLYFLEPCMAQISSFPDTSISSISLYQHPCGSNLSVNLQWPYSASSS